ncbi:hypothetical protein KKH03_03205 [Patescibacteria group bacterium]|nr:hypothetical protein [Patescibacteria group bacterium]
MAEKQDSNQIEQQLYEAAVEEAVDKVSRLAKNKVDEADGLIDELLNNAQLEGKHELTFRGEVLRKISEKKQAAEDGREKQILEKFEGQVVKRSGQLRFAGIDENVKIYARGGNLYRRVFGKRYNADDVHDLLQDVQKTENDIEKRKLEIEMLKAKVDASKNVLRNARFMFKQKRKGRIFAGYFKDAANSLKASYYQKQRAKDEFASGDKAGTKDIEKKSRQLERKQAVLDKLMAKIEARRQNGRDVFNRQFGAQVEVLQKMSGELLKQEADRLRDDVKKFGQVAGIVHFEYFLNEALGIAPQKGEYLADIGYSAPTTPLEIAKEKAQFGRWLEFVLHETPSAHLVAQTLEIMRNKMPSELVDILQNRNVDKVETQKYELRFLFSGRDTTNAPILDKSRRAKPDPDTIVRFLRYSKDHDLSGMGNLNSIIQIFAKDWPKDYTANDFDYVLPFIRQGKEAPQKEVKSAEGKVELNRSQQKVFEEIWWSVFGTKASEKEMWDFAEQMKKEFADKYDVEISRFLNSSISHDLLRFLYTGKFEGTEIVTDGNKLLKHLPDDSSKVFFSEYLKIKQLLSHKYMDRKLLLKMLKELPDQPEFIADGISSLDADMFEKLYNECKKSKSKKNK